MHEPADVLGDGPAVVVEDDDEPLRLDVHDVVQGLVARAGRQRPVADDGDDVGLAGGVLEGERHPERVGEAGARVAGRQHVVGALRRLGEPGQAAGGPDRLETVAPAGDELVGVALVGRVPDDPVLRAVEGAVERQGELDDPEVGRQVSARLGDRLDDDVPAFLAERGQVFRAQSLEIPGAFDLVQHSHRVS